MSDITIFDHQRLKELRTESTLSQAALAKLAKCSGGDISLIERGQKKPTDVQVTRFATAFNVDTSTLFKTITMPDAEPPAETQSPNGLVPTTDLTRIFHRVGDIKLEDGSILLKNGVGRLYTATELPTI